MSDHVEGTAPNGSKPTAAELRAMLAEAEANEGDGGTESVAEVVQQPTPEEAFPGAVAEFDIPCADVLRAGKGTTIAMRIVEPCTILGIVLAEGFDVIGLNVGGKKFDEAACKGLEEGMGGKPAYAGVTVLGSKDNIELFVRNVSEDDRQFDGVFVLGAHKVVGYRPPVYSGLINPGGDAGGHAGQDVRGRGNNRLLAMGSGVPDPSARMPPPTPGQARPTPAQYGGMSGPRAAPPPVNLSRPVRRPALQNGPRLHEGVPVTPGPNEVAVCMTREQAAKLYKLAVLREYLPPFATVDLQAILERALS